MAVKVETEMMISGEDGEAADVCASCGIAQVNEIKLNTCTACESVRYCSVKCQKSTSRSTNEHAKNGWLSCVTKFCLGSLKAVLGVTVPSVICRSHSVYNCLMACCSKTICLGCSHADIIRQLGLETPHIPTCAFCREPLPKTKEEFDAMAMKRVEKKNPVAMRQMGVKRDDEGDYNSAFEYYTKAAELGDAFAHFNLSVMYSLARGVEKDEKKEVYHLEVAAIGGNVLARHNLGCHEENNGGMERAVKHWIIAANMGYDESLKTLWKCYAKGFVEKDDLNATLRAHHAAVDATKSPQREQAEEYRKRSQE